MKRTIFKIFFVCALFSFAISSGQCLTSDNGLYPSATFIPTCGSVSPNVIAPNSYAGEYSNVEVVAGEEYTFASSNPTDYITISTDDGLTASAFGVTPITWTSDVTGVIRYYLHLSDQCGEDIVNRVRTISCGVAPCILPQVTFSKTFDCGSSSFEVIADITDIGSASTITVTDDQSSSPQTVDSAGQLVFGPYAFGTSVILTATNDDTPICNVVSPPQIFTACPPVNDDCANAIALNCGDVLTGQSTDGATGGSDLSCVGTIGDDVWYSFVGDGQIIAVTASASAGDPQIEAYESTDGTCSGFTAGNCIAADGSFNPIVNVVFVSVIGQTYYIHLGSAINGDPAVVFDLSITCQTPPTPPANDECDGAESLTVNPDASCAIVTTGTVSGATASAADATGCFGTEDDDVWYSFIATGTIQSISLLNIAGSTTDLVHSLWSGADCSSLTLVPGSCSDNDSSVPVGLVVGQKYYIRVYTYTLDLLQDTTFDICVGTPPAPPANDECDGAIALDVNPDASCALFTSATIQSATPTAVDATSCGGTEDDDVWFSFIATDTIQDISLINVTGSTTDLFHSLWTGNCAALTLVPGSCSDNNTSTATSLTAGEAYFLRVYSTTDFSGQTTTFDVCIGTPPPPPANDDCTGAIEITVGGTFATAPIIGSNVSSTSTFGLPPFSCQENRSNDVWYSVVVPDSGSLTIETQTAPGTQMTDSVITIYSGTCGALVEVGCDDDGPVGGDNFSLKELTGLTPGSTIYIGVWKWGVSSDGEFQLAAYDVSLLGNSSFENDGFTSYPNSVKNVMNLSYNKNISNVTVFNLLGQEVMTKAINASQSQIDMSHLSAGSYIVKVTADNLVKSIKVIKE